MPAIWIDEESKKTLQLAKKWLALNGEADPSYGKAINKMFKDLKIQKFLEDKK